MPVPGTVMKSKHSCILYLIWWTTGVLLPFIDIQQEKDKIQNILTLFPSSMIFKIKDSKLIKKQNKTKQSRINDKISNVPASLSPRGPVQLWLSPAHRVYLYSAQAMQLEVTQLNLHTKILTVISFPTCSSLKRIITATAKRKIYLWTSSSPKLTWRIHFYYPWKLLCIKII